MARRPEAYKRDVAEAQTAVLVAVFEKRLWPQLVTSVRGLPENSIREVVENTRRIIGAKSSTQTTTRPTPVSPDIASELWKFFNTLETRIEELPGPVKDIIKDMRVALDAVAEVVPRLIESRVTAAKTAKPVRKRKR